MLTSFKCYLLNIVLMIIISLCSINEKSKVLLKYMVKCGFNQIETYHGSWSIYIYFKLSKMHLPIIMS